MEAEGEYWEEKKTGTVGGHRKRELQGRGGKSQEERRGGERIRGGGGEERREADRLLQKELVQDQRREALRGGDGERGRGETPHPATSIRGPP